MLRDGTAPRATNGRGMEPRSHEMDTTVTTTDVSCARARPTKGTCVILISSAPSLEMRKLGWAFVGVGYIRTLRRLGLEEDPRAAPLALGVLLRF